MIRRVDLPWTCGLCRLILLGAVALSLSSCGGGGEEESPFLSYLPQAGEAGPFRPEDEPQHVEGDDLFLLINGGAEIYHEYGFKQAVFQSYVDENDRSLNLEIYEMSDPSAAYGIYTFKKGEGGREMDLGDEANLQDYYLNVWKGNFLVTVVGFDTEEETLAGLETLAEAVVDKITESGAKPPLVALLPEKDLNPDSVKYLRGYLALFNIHELATGNIFGVREGVTADMGDDKVFLFAYDSQNEAEDKLMSAWEALSHEEWYRDVAAGEDECSAVDSEDRHLAGKTVGRFILLAVGASSETARATLDKLADSVTGHPSASN